MNIYVLFMSFLLLPVGLLNAAAERPQREINPAALGDFQVLPQNCLEEIADDLPSRALSGLSRSSRSMYERLRQVRAKRSSALYCWATQPITEKILEGHSDTVDTLSFSPNGKTLISGSHDEAIKVWDVQLGKVKRTYVARFEAISSVAFSPIENNLFASIASPGSTVRLWNIEQPEEVQILNLRNNAVAIAFSRDGKQLVIGDEANTIWLANVGDNKTPKKAVDMDTCLQRLMISFVSANKLLAAGYYKFGWKPFLVEVTLDPKQVVSKEIPGDDQDAIIALSPDNKTLAAGYVDGTIILRDIRTLAEIKRFRGNAAVFKLLFSHDGNVVASGCKNRTVMLWNAKTGEQIKEFKTPRSASSLAFSRDDKMLAAGLGDGTVRMWASW